MSDAVTPPPVVTPPPATDPIGIELDRLSVDQLRAERAALAKDVNRPDLKAHDAALARKGEVPIDPKRGDDWKDHGMAEKPTAADYDKADFGKFAGNETAATSLKDLAAGMSLSADAGNQLTSRIATVLSQLDAIPRENWENWGNNMDRITMKVIGGDQKAYDALVSQAKAALARSGTEVAKKLAASKDPVLLRQLANAQIAAKELAGHIALKDPVLLRQLANAQIAHERMQAKYGKK